MLSKVMKHLACDCLLHLKQSIVTFYFLLGGLWGPEDWEMWLVWKVNFLWKSSPLKVSYRTLKHLKHIGKIGFPNFKHFYSAVQSIRIVDWNAHVPCKDWVTLENIFSPLPLKSIPWIRRKHMWTNLSIHLQYTRYHANILLHLPKINKSSTLRPYSEWTQTSCQILLLHFIFQ